MGRVITNGRGHALVIALTIALTITSTTVSIGAVGGAVQAAPPTGDAWVVTLGDSAISGEAGRWAGNTNNASWRHDTGSDAYYDNAGGTAETTPGCHRSKSAEVHIGGGVNSLNLACSGARTSHARSAATSSPASTGTSAPAGKGQAVQLQEFARDPQREDAVTVLIGANNFGFADIVQQCVTNWLTSPWWWKNYCNDDSAISEPVHRRAPSTAQTDEVAERDPQRAPGDDQRRILGSDVHDHRPDVLVADPARVGVPLPRERVDPPERSAGAACGTGTPTGPTTPPS